MRIESWIEQEQDHDHEMSKHKVELKIVRTKWVEYNKSKPKSSIPTGAQTHSEFIGDLS